MSPLTPAAASISPKRRRLFSREDQVRKIRDRLTAPRFQMMILLALTGGAGFLTSWALLRGGMDSMALRYPIAVGAGYLVFFVLLRIWIALQSDPLEHLGDALDGCGDLPELIVPSGHSGGSGSVSHSSSSSWDLDFDFGLGDGEALVFVVVVAIVAVLGLGVVIYALYLAPLLLAEVLVDGVLLVGFYKRLKRPEPEHWALCAIRRTWIPAIIVAVTFFFAGVIFQSLAPDARSIGGVWKSVSSDTQ